VAKDDIERRFRRGFSHERAMNPNSKAAGKGRGMVGRFYTRP
jgi:hypothetical protein